MTRRRDCLMTPHFLKWSFGPKIESVDGICQQTDSRNRFYLDVKTGPKCEVCCISGGGSTVTLTTYPVGRNRNCLELYLHY